MALIVQKFGGTSVANIDKIQEVALLVKSEKEKNNQVIVVVSAMAGATNHLVTLCNEVSKLVTASQLAEYDAALCSGEMVTASLLALALQEKKIMARSVFGWQLPILTDDNYGKALVKSLSDDLIKNCLSQGIVPIVAGFQGVNNDKRLSTLGRGGSDTTAALLAASMQADRCEIYTDVAGVFTADPRVVHDAKKITKISFEEMLEFASNGAKVLHPRCVELARRYQIPIHVLSSFSLESGTLITAKDKIMENRVITGITSNKNLLSVFIENPVINFVDICNLFSENKIGIEFIQNIATKNFYNFVCHLTDQNRLQNLLVKLKDNVQISDYTIDNAVAAIVIVGYGVKNDPTLVSKILSILEKSKIIVTMVNISEVKIVLLVREQDTEKAIRNLHELCHGAEKC